MIKFEEHDGKLFRMLEEPVPLKENDANVLVRFITHGVIGEYVIEHCLDCNQKDVPIFVDSVDSDGDVTGYIENGNEYICCPFPMFEIIGTPVADGSAEWALYQMMKGEKICHKKSPSVMYCKHASGIRREAGYNYVAFDMSISVWLNGADKNGWQIYHEPKPLLAEAKVGDLCQLRNGEWVQIECVCRFPHDIGVRVGKIWYWWNGKSSTDTPMPNIDIIYVEPLAPEGTKDWAWQMMLLGKIIIHSGFGVYRHENATWKMNNGTARSCLAGKSACSKEQWVANAFGNGWEIYKEPELKYKVGDWVEWRGDQYMVKSAPPQSGDRYNIRSPYDELGWSVKPENITRKLSPADIVIRIGCLSGTIAKSSDPNYFLMLHSRPLTDCNYSMIKFSAIDTKTRELVESLLKAQEEEK